MFKIFIGYDHRQPVSYHALVQSIIDTARFPVSITPLVLDTLPIDKVGLTPFTYTRFLVPYLCNFDGYALFLDADMIALTDLTELMDIIDMEASITVPDVTYKFERASFMLFNNEKCDMLTPEFVSESKKLHTLGFLPENEIAFLPKDWNVLVGYDEVPDKPKLLHYTQGVPIFPETTECPMADVWQFCYNKMRSAVSWTELMGKSVHAISAELGDGDVIKLPKFMFDLNEEEKTCTLKDKYLNLLKKLTSGSPSHANDRTANQ